MKTLTHPILGDRKFKDVEAQRLLAMPNNGGWKLKETKADDTHSARDKKKAKGWGKQSRATD